MNRQAPKCLRASDQDLAFDDSHVQTSPWIQVSCMTFTSDVSCHPHLFRSATLPRPWTFLPVSLSSIYPTLYLLTIMVMGHNRFPTHTHSPYWACIWLCPPRLRDLGWGSYLYPLHVQAWKAKNGSSRENSYLTNFILTTA